MHHLTQNVISETFSQPVSWLSTEKLNLTQQKQTCICNKLH